MEAAGHKPIVSRRPLVSAILVVLALLSFVVVSRLVNLYHRHQKELAQRIYQHGLAEQQAGKFEGALEDFRAALVYDPDNDQIQLNLARTLRDTGRLTEAESYLLTLWERTPQDSAINLALGRLAARRGNIEDALRYYHNAIYGVWKSDPESNRRMARFELIDFLLQRNALSDAQSELIALLPTLPDEPLVRLRVADMFARAQDFSHALTQYQVVLQKEHGNAAALFGAGQAAFQLGRYRTAHTYLLSAVNASPPHPQAKPLLQTANLVLGADPFRRGISDAERNRRIREAFNRAGERLDNCGLSRGVNLSSAQANSDLAALKSQWLAMKPKLSHMSRQMESDLPDVMMDLVFQIEQQTQKECGSPEGLDQALLLISRDRAGVDR
jgi:tetratricopeptide (TPR) repeat protein